MNDPYETHSLRYWINVAKTAAVGGALLVAAVAPFHANSILRHFN